MTAQILFACTGNICRSPFAERLAAHLVTGLPPAHPAGGWQFASAGIGALVGWPMDPGMAAELAARGGSAEGFVARQLTATMARGADLILTLESTHRDHILDEWPALARRTLVLGKAARVVAELGAPGDDTLAALRAHRGAPDRADDIMDPYRRGEAAAREAAQQIERALESLLGGAGPGVGV